VIAVGMAMLLVLIRASSPRDAVLGRMPGMDGFQDIKDHPQAETIPGLMIYRFDSALLFFNSDCFKSRIRVHIKAAAARPQYFLLDAESMPFMDSTDAASLEEVVGELSVQGISLAVARPNDRLRLVLERTGLKQKIGAGNLFPRIESAVAPLQLPARSQ
jgi:MFS superfamily sulfate permease-like transporter